MPNFLGISSSRSEFASYAQFIGLFGRVPVNMIQMPKKLSTNMDPIPLRSPEQLGRAIAELRKARGLLQTNLAANAGISRNTLIALEDTGNGKLSTILTVLSLLKAELLLAPPPPLVPSAEDEAAEIPIDL